MTDLSSLATLAEALERAAATDAGITYLEANDPERNVRVPYAELRQRSLRVLAELQQRGLGRGAEIVFQLDSNQAFVEAFWACQLGGMLPVPINAGATDEHLNKVFKVLEQTRSPTLLTQGRIPERLWEYARRNGIYDRFRPVFDAAIDIAQLPAEGSLGRAAEIESEDVASLQYSSGSTGTPKGVVLTHANLLSDIQDTIDHCGMTRDDSFLSWVPLTHDLGMVMFHMLPLVLGVDQHIMPATRFARRPLAWLELTSHHRATVLCSPNFGYHHALKAFKKSSGLDLDLSSVRIIINGAEPISKPLSDEFMQAMATFGLAETAMWPTWGLAEASAAITIRAPEAPVQSVRIRRDELKIGERVPLMTDPEEGPAAEIVCVGVEVARCTLSIRDDAGHPVPPDHYGHIWASGPMISAGYYGEPLAEGEHWLNTGDLGFMHDDALYIAGRAKDLIIVNGVNYHPNDLERVVSAGADIEAGKVTCCSVFDERLGRERVMVFVVHRQDAEQFVPVEKQVRAALGQHAQLEIDHVVPIKTMPKTTSGKIQRYRLVERYLDGEFDAAIATRGNDGGRADGSDLERMLLALFNEIIPDVHLGLEDNFVDAGVSSLSLAEVADRLDALYPDQLELSDYLEHPTIPELARFLAEQGAPVQV